MKHAIGTLLIVTLSAAAGHALAAAPPDPGTREPAVWEKHQYSFAFLGFTSTYSCDGLAAKLKQLLLAAGARSDVKVQAGACASGFGRPDKFARAELSFYALAPAGTAKADATPVDGVWKPVTLGYMTPRDLGRGDCELVEQFKSNVLPLFTTRNVVNHTTCIPHQESGSNIDLQFEALSSAKALTASAPRDPRATAPTSR